MDRSSRLLAVSIVLLAAILRCLAIGRFSLGNDEIEEVRWSSKPLGELVRTAARDGAHPPLEFIVQAGLDRAGGPEWVRRVANVVAGILTVALVMFLGSRWFGNAGGFASSLLLACSPIHVRFSQEVRPYSIALLFVVGGIAALEEYRRNHSRWLAGAWFAAVLGAAYTLYFAGLIGVLVSLVFVFAYRKDDLKRLWRFMPVAIAGWVVLYLPWIPHVFGVAGRQPPVERQHLDPSWLRYRLQVLGTGDWLVEPVSLGSYAFWFLALAGILLARRSRPARVAACWLLCGAALQIAVLQLRPHFAAVRHLLPSWLGAIFLAGYAVSVWSRRSPLRELGWAAVALVVVFDARTLRDYYDHGRPQWSEVAAYLNASVGKGEHLIAANGWVLRNLGYYWNERALGRPGVALEGAGTEIVGPSWIVTAVCPLDPEVEAQLRGVSVRRAFPMTNHCEIRFLPPGQRLVLPHGFCSSDI